VKTIRWDDGTKWDDPNTRWGDPSYVLEPGDPGYVGPTPTNQTPKTKRRTHMTRSSYFPVKTGDQIPWLGNWKNKLPGHATILGLSPSTVTGSVADAEWLIHLLSQWLPAARTFSEACTDAMEEAMNGDGYTLMALPVFTPPPGGIAVNTGALKRIFKVVQDIRNTPACTDAIASDLGMVGSEQGAPDWNVFGPVLKISRAPAGVTVGWGWQGKSAFLDQCEIEVDRGDAKGWVLLAIDTTPGYVDTEAIPSQPTKWQYRAIYRVGDQRVGQWSAAASVIVGG